MAILFGNSARSQSKNLVEFRAGKMNMVGNMVHPDKRKGMLYVYQADDSLMHFCWKDRGTGVVEDDLIIFPDDVEYKSIPQCTTGRVFLLKFKSSSRRIFFWMQEPKTDKDEDYVKKINDVLNNPPPPGRSGGSTPGTDMSNIESLLSGDADLHSLLSGMSQQQLRQLMGVSNLGSILGDRSSMGPQSPTSSQTSASSTAPASSVTSAPSASSSLQSSNVTTPSTAAPQIGTIQLSQLQNILSGIRVPEGAASQQEEAPAHIDLSSAISSDVVHPLSSNPEFISRLQGMLPQTGEEVPTAQQIQETLQSPQFQQALSSFSSAMQSGQLAPLMGQFGLRQESVRAAAQGADMESFVRALQSALQPSTEEQAADKKEETKEEKKPDDDDDNMALD